MLNPEKDRMTNLSDFNAQANAATDREHQFQLAWLESLSKDVRAGADGTSVARKLHQLLTFSEAHFLSEEILMRQNSYDDFEDHTDDHVHMLDVLRQMITDHAAGHSALLADTVDHVLSFIGQHIATRDKRLADYLRSGQ
jgi:hemerythrin